MPAASLRNYELSKQIPGGEALKTFLRAGISTDWLLTGEGPMLKAAASPSLPAVPIRYTAENQPVYYPQDTAPQSGTNPPPSGNTAPAFFALEYATRSETGQDLLFSTTFLKKLTGSKPAGLRLVDITDDSMQPSLQPGWQVMVDTQITYIRSGIYAIRLDNEIMCKRLEPRPGNLIEVISDNPLYSSYTIRPDTVTEQAFIVVGRVIWLAGPIR